MRFKLAVGLIAIVAAGFFATSARAYDGPYGWWGYNLDSLYRNLDSKVPHFAAYPPVYYSYPVPRTYGYSPFAYPPGIMTPEIIEDPVEPVTILNPYVKQNSSEEPEAEEKTVAKSPQQPTPLVILNHHVRQPRSFVQTAD